MLSTVEVEGPGSSSSSSMLSTSSLIKSAPRSCRQSMHACVWNNNHSSRTGQFGCHDLDWGCGSARTKSDIVELVLPQQETMAQYQKMCSYELQWKYCIQRGSAGTHGGPGGEERLGPSVQRPGRGHPHAGLSRSHGSDKGRFTHRTDARRPCKDNNRPTPYVIIMLKVRIKLLAQPSAVHRVEVPAGASAAEASAHISAALSVTAGGHGALQLSLNKKVCDRAEP